MAGPNETWQRARLSSLDKSLNDRESTSGIFLVISDFYTPTEDMVEVSRIHNAEIVFWD